MEIVTIANVSGFIAVAIVVVHFVIPNLLIVVLSNSLGSSNNAVTWSVAGRTIHNSIWPTLLRTESSTGKGVRFSVRAISLFSTFAVLLISIAGVVTPLGLYQDVVPGSTKDVAFSFAPDQGPFGYGGMPRPNLPFNRLCGFNEPIPCPGIHEPYSRVLTNDSLTVTMKDGNDGRIPKDKYDYFQSGSKDSQTISSLWDIEWRTYNYNTDTKAQIPFMNGSKYVVGQYSNYDSLLLRGGVNLVDGLIVDSDTGAIGFRNHTLPPLQSNSSASWQEDLLFVEPESVCVPNNLTLQVTVSGEILNSSLTKATLVDKGGFASLDRTYKHHINGSDQQNHFDLYARAYLAAYANNVYTATAYGVSDINTTFMHSKYGDAYNLTVSDDTTIHWDRLYTTVEFSDFLPLPGGLGSGVPGPGILNHTHNITMNDFGAIWELCQWFTPQNQGNISTIAVGCNMAQSPGRPLNADGSPGSATGAIREPGSLWEVDLYSCATAVKASIKTVSFSANGPSLDGLTASIAPSGRTPWWAVERNDGLALEDAAPLWGLVDETLPVPVNTTLIQKEALYLPGSVGNESIGGSPTVENLPGIDFYGPALSSLAQVGALSPDSLWPVLDYTGIQSQAMARKWQDLSHTADGMAQIHRMIWGDIAANSVVGTKGLMGARDLQKRDVSGVQQIATSELRVLYHWPFAVPAFGVCLVLVFVWLAVVWSSVANGAPLRSLKQGLQRTSVGRIMGVMLYAQQPPSTKDWIRVVGRQEVRYEGVYPVAERGGPQVVQTFFPKTSYSPLQ